MSGIPMRAVACSGDAPDPVFCFYQVFVSLIMAVMFLEALVSIQLQNMGEDLHIIRTVSLLDVRMFAGWLQFVIVSSTNGTQIWSHDHMLSNKQSTTVSQNQYYKDTHKMYQIIQELSSPELLYHPNHAHSSNNFSRILQCQLYFGDELSSGGLEGEYLGEGGDICTVVGLVGE